MLIVAIDTATPTLVLGIARYENGAHTMLWEKSLTDCRAHNETLVPELLLGLHTIGATPADIAQVVVGQGPGPFTGLRVGLASAVAFAAALNIPVLGVSTLEAIARAGYRQYPEMFAACGPCAQVVALTDARRREVYWQSFSIPAGAGPAEAFVADFATDQVSAPAIVRADYSLYFAAAGLPESARAGLSLSPDARLFEVVLQAQDLLGCALHHPEQPPRPRYLRRPDAAEPKARPRSAALPEVDIAALLAANPAATAPEAP